MNTDYDVIIIGSGIGALTTASLLAKLGNKKVLVLERHFKIGGFTHTFRRKSVYEWDVGVHYVGGLAEGTMLRALFDAVTENGVKWQKMPEPFEKFVYPDFTFSVYGDKQKFLGDLKAQFPNESEALDRYFKDVEAFSQWFSKQFTIKALPAVFSKAAHFLHLTGDGHAEITTKEYMDKNFKDPKLKALLCSQWGDFGLSPIRSSFAIHSMIVTHYFDGGYFPIGSSAKIADSIIPIVEKAGGLCEINHEVTEILLEGDKAVGVKVNFKKGKEVIQKEYKAPVIISDAGAFNTYFKLLPKKYSDPFKEPLTSLASGGATSITLYIGFKESPTKLGFKGENYWMFPSYDHDAIYDSRNQILDGKPPMVYLSFPSLKNPEAEAPTAEIITFADYGLFQKWKEEVWKKRGEDYEALKEKIADAMLGFVEERFPGFRSLVDFYELSTPLTNEHFTGHHEGNIYGLVCTPERFKQEWLGVRTPVENLYLTGADACSPGIAGAFMGGVASSAVVLGFSGTLRLMKEFLSGKSSKSV